MGITTPSSPGRTRTSVLTSSASLAAGIEPAMPLAALAALAELHPASIPRARTPARSISFLSFVISIPSSLFNHVRLSLYHKWRFDDETIVKFR